MIESDKNPPKPDVCDLHAKPIETLGEAFSDGSFIEPVHDPADQDTLQLMLFDGEAAQIGPRVEHENQVYVPRQIDPAIARELYLPAEFRPNESVPQLAMDLVHLVQRYSSLREEAAELFSQFFFADWLMDGLPAAPSLAIIGPDSREVTQILALIKCLSRHALILTEVTASSLASLPTEVGLTLAIDQPEFNGPLERLLNASRKRTTKVPRRGTLWSPFFSKVIHCANHFQAWPIRALKLVVVPNGHALPLLDEQEQARIARDFQPRLLSYRFDNFGTVRVRIIETSNTQSSARAIVGALPAPGFEDTKLHAKILDLVADSAADVSENRWTDPTVVLIESLLLSCHIPNQTARYMGQYAEAMMTILSARGEERKFQPNQVGGMVRDLGFETERRDSQGIKLLLTESVRRRIHKLAFDFAVPSIESPIAGCSHCEVFGEKKR